MNEPAGDPGATTGLPRPKQPRSRRTLERILRATEDLLNEAPFARVSIADIAARAGIAVGTVYTRFPTKEDILTELHARYERERELFEVDLIEAGESDLSLEERLRRIVADMVTTFRKRRGLMFSYALARWMQWPESVPEKDAKLGRVYDRLTDFLLGARDEIRHPEPERAARLAIVTANAICRDLVILKPRSHPGSVDMDEEALVSEVTEMLLRWLR